MRLLSVDWDWFFDNSDQWSKDKWQLYDWGHSENWGAGLQEMLWLTRALGFARHGYPLPGTSGAECDFWDRFKISPRAQLFVADSHCMAVDPRVMRNVTEVWNYDAHHDVYSNIKQVREAGRVDCATWLVAYILAGLRPRDIQGRYPQWFKEMPEPQPAVPIHQKIDDGSSPDVEFDRVFVCRSGAWTPPWLDDAFEELVCTAPVKKTIVIDEYLMKREFDAEQVKVLAKQELEMLKGVSSLATRDSYPDFLREQEENLKRVAEGAELLVSSATCSQPKE